jgi:hypothetical protein
MVKRFPRPDARVIAGLMQLRDRELNMPDDSRVLLDVDELPRPWEPASCTSGTRAVIWIWLDEVATWINDQHLWSVSRPGIPECWPDHPHIIHDLAAVACARYYASLTLNPLALETWHRDTLPAFLSRLTERIGDSCQPGEHAPRPRHERDKMFARGRKQRNRRYGADAQSTAEANS